MSPRRTMPDSRLMLTMPMLAMVCSMLVSCETYRIEHHPRPGFYQKAAAGQLPGQVHMDDGTVIVYESPSEMSGLGRKGDEARKVFEPREETEDPTGKKTVTLRAILPEHVLLNTLTCIRNEEYELLWDQGLAKRTKDRYVENEEGLEEFSAFMRKYRHELVATLTRMTAGMSGQEVAIDYLNEGLIRCRLRPQIADPFVFRSLDMVKDESWLKLVIIQ